MAENENTSSANAASGFGSINIQDILAKCLQKWWLFVISVAICMAVAAWHLMKTPNMYTRSAMVLIKSDKGGANSEFAAFSDLRIGGTSLNLGNEIATLKSPEIMERVVSRLGLETTYTTDARLRRQLLYGSSLPVKVDFVEPKAGYFGFTINLKGDSIYTLTDFIGATTSPDYKLKGALNDTIETPVGKLAIRGHVDKYSPEHIYVTKSTPEAVAGRFLGGLNVAQASNQSQVITLTYTDMSPQRAEDLLRTLVDVYNDNWVYDRNQITNATSDFIRDRLKVIESELGNVDSDISSFKSEHLMPDVGAAASIAMQQASQAQSQIRDLELKISMARYVRDYLSTEANKFQLLPTTTGIDNLDIAGQISTYNTQLMERNSLVTNSSESNPMVAEMDKVLAGLRNVLLTSIDNQIHGLNAQVNSVRGVGAQATSQIASNPVQSKYLLNVERQQKVKESLYLYLLQKREENELMQAFTAYNTKIISKPRGSNAPTSPVRRNIWLAALVIGLAIPAAIITLGEVLNTKVRGRKDLEGVTIPFVGEIPQYGKKIDIGYLSMIRKYFGKGKKSGEDNITRPIVVKNHSRNMINEAFRVVRTNLEFMLAANPNEKVVSITSANPGSGKTFFTFNLGLSLAIKDKRVLVIDLDLRKGSLSRYVDNPKIGISDFLAGKTDDLMSIVYPVNNQTGNLDVIPVGTIPPNPTELLFNAKMKMLIEEMRHQYDYIFIDCPPIEIVADATIINKFSDMTLFIIRAGLFDRSMLPEIERLYANKKYCNMAIILNGTEAASGRYGYKYGYKYGYSYGKYGSNYGGYSSDKDDNKA